MTQRLSRRLRFFRPTNLASPVRSAGLKTTLGSVSMVLLGMSLGSAACAEPNFPITAGQRLTAKQVADAGVPLSDLAPNAPDSYTVKKGDTLWDISSLFLKKPWRWPELWGMNLEQIRNPHLIFPGQVLVLDKSNGRARLHVGQALGPDGSVKLTPRMRSDTLSDAIGAVPLHLIQPFLNEAVILSSAEQLNTAPRIVATQEGRVVLTRGDTAYVRGDSGGVRDWQVFREPRPLKDPTTGEILGYEAVYVGTAELVSLGASQGPDVPDSYTMTSMRIEGSVGDRLVPTPARDSSSYAPHAPSGPMEGQIVSIYGGSPSAGQNYIVALNRGSSQGMERGHVLALLRDGRQVIDRTDPLLPTIKLPNERIGTLFVFRVFDRMSYALVLSTQDAVKVGDRFTTP